jgi:hypothetical protein
MYFGTSTVRLGPGESGAISPYAVNRIDGLEVYPCQGYAYLRPSSKVTADAYTVATAIRIGFMYMQEDISRQTDNMVRSRL